MKTLAQALRDIEHLILKDGSFDERTRLLIVHFWRHIDARLDALNQRIDQIMPTLSDIKAQIDATLTKVTENTDELGAVRDLVVGLKATIADLQAQLATAIANNDPAAMQAVADGLAVLGTKLDEQKAAEAALANT